MYFKFQERIVDDLTRENSKLNEIATSKIQSLEVMNRELLMEKVRLILLKYANSLT